MTLNPYVLLFGYDEYNNCPEGELKEFTPTIDKDIDRILTKITKKEWLKSLGGFYYKIAELNNSRYTGEELKQKRRKLEVLVIYDEEKKSYHKKPYHIAKEINNSVKQYYGFYTYEQVEFSNEDKIGYSHYSYA